MTGLKTQRCKWLAAVGLFLGVALAAGFWVNHRRVGRVLDSYRSVPVYDNGLLFFRSYGRRYSPDGYYYGQKWQCVEYVKRFYHQAKGHKMPDVWGHARDYFDSSLPDGALNPRRGLVQYRNGTTARPQPDDLLVFTDTKFGHVAIVTQVSDNSLEVVQQNILGKPRQRFSLVSSNGCWFVTAPRLPAGWLRLPAGHDPLPKAAGS
jgi:surface antigen